MCAGQCYNELFSGAMDLGNFVSASVALNLEIFVVTGKLKPNTIEINKKSSVGDHIVTWNMMRGIVMLTF